MGYTKKSMMNKWTSLRIGDPPKTDDQDQELVALKWNNVSWSGETEV